MNNPLREYIYITISLLVYTLIIVFLYLVASTSKGVLYVEEDKRSFVKEMQIHREFIVFDNKTVTGDDVLMAIKRYKNAYDFAIEVSAGELHLMIKDNFIKKYEDCICTKNVIKPQYFSECERIKKVLIAMGEDYIVDSPSACDDTRLNILWNVHFDLWTDESVRRYMRGSVGKDFKAEILRGINKEVIGIKFKEI